MTAPERINAAVIFRRPSFLISTWFCAGLFPYASGTIGTLATLPLYVVLMHLGVMTQLAIIVAIVIIGTWSADAVARAIQIDDPKIVVIDESAGILLALWIASAHGVVAIAITVVLFRVLDIVKPWPISALERLRPAGVGIMADDLLAGWLRDYWYGGCRSGDANSCSRCVFEASALTFVSGATRQADGFYCEFA